MNLIKACQEQKIACAASMHLHKRDGYSWKPVDLYAWFVTGKQVDSFIYSEYSEEIKDKLVWLQLPAANPEFPVWVKAWSVYNNKKAYPNLFGGYCETGKGCDCLTQGCWDANGWFLSRKIRNGRLAQVTWQIGLIEEGAFVPLIDVEFVPKKFKVSLREPDPFGIPDNWYIGGTYKIKAQPVLELEKYAGSVIISHEQILGVEKQIFGVENCAVCRGFVICCFFTMHPIRYMLVKKGMCVVVFP